MRGKSDRSGTNLEEDWRAVVLLLITSSFNSSSMDAGDGRTVVLSLIKISSNSSLIDFEADLHWSLVWLMSPLSALMATGFEVDLHWSLG